MKARCFHCGTDLIQGDTTMVADVSGEGYENDNEAMIQSFRCPMCGRDYTVIDPSEEQRKGDYKAYWND